jgi:hypothetical protein
MYGLYFRANDTGSDETLTIDRAQVNHNRDRNGARDRSQAQIGAVLRGAEHGPVDSIIGLAECHHPIAELRSSSQEDLAGDREN